MPSDLYAPSALNKHMRRCLLDAHTRTRTHAGTHSNGGSLRSAACYLLGALAFVWCIVLMSISYSSGKPINVLLDDIGFGLGLGPDALAPGTHTLRRTAEDSEATHVASHACTAAFWAADPPVVAVCPVSAGHVECPLAHATFPHVVVVSREDVRTYTKHIGRLLGSSPQRKVVLIDTQHALPEDKYDELFTAGLADWTVIRGAAPSCYGKNYSRGIVAHMSPANTMATALTHPQGIPVQRLNETGFGPLVHFPEALSFALHSSRTGGIPHLALMFTEAPASNDWHELVSALVARGIVVRLLVPPGSTWAADLTDGTLSLAVDELYTIVSGEYGYIRKEHAIPPWEVARVVTHYDIIACLKYCDVGFAHASDLALAAGVPVLVPIPGDDVRSGNQSLPLNSAEDGELDPAVVADDAYTALGRPRRVVEMLRKWLQFNPHEPAPALARRVASLLARRQEVGLLLRAARDMLERRTEASVLRLLHPPSYRALQPQHVLGRHPQAMEVAEVGCHRLLQVAGRRDANATAVSVAFYTYELSPINSGGAGVVIAALAIELIAKGHTAVVIGHMSCSEVEAWARYVLLYLGDESLRARFHVHCVWNLVSLEDVQRLMPAARISNEVIRNSLVAALAMQRAYMLHEFDVVEVFDYNGVGTDILRARADLIDPVPTLRLSRTQELVSSWELPPSILAHASATWFRPYAPYVWVPLHVAVIVRAHGTIQAIDESESTLADQADRRACYSMEQYAAESADAVFAQSQVILNLYQRVYNLPPANLVFAPPPMKRVLDMFIRGATIAGTMCEGAISNVPVPCDTRDSENCIIVLALGKLQLVKGPETVAAAFAQAVATLRPEIARSMHLVYVGQDLPCPLHQRAMSECIESIVPPQYFRRVHFAPGVPRTCIPRVVEALQPTVAIMASEFETYNLVAHELAFLRVPLIVSDIPAYREFFDERNAYVFESRNATSLASQLTLVAEKAVQNETLRLAELQYSDPLEPYQQLVRRMHERCRTGWMAPRLNITATHGVPSLGLRHALEQDLMRVDSTNLCDLAHP